MYFLTQKGFNLIEVLIAMTLMAMALLSMDAMQIVALRQQRHQYWITVGNNQLSVMTEWLRLPLSDTLRQQRFMEWNNQNQQLLPQGQGIWDGGRITLLWGRATWPTCQNQSEVDSGCLSVVIR